MTENRKIEIFSAGCPACEETTSRIKELACPNCDGLSEDEMGGVVAEGASALGDGSFPDVGRDGRVADCGAGGGRKEAVWQAGGLGQPLS